MSRSRSNSVEAQPPTVTIGRITTNESLDREEIGSYPLTIVATDVTDNPLNMSIEILITVVDKNDNTPTFAIANFNFELLESKSDTFITTLTVRCLHDSSAMATLIWYVLLLQATDLDSGNNSQIDFSLDVAVQSLFSLISTGPLSTELHLNHGLDRESIDSYSFRVIAMDRGNPPLIGVASIIIRVAVSFIKCTLE